MTTDPKDIIKVNVSRPGLNMQMKPPADILEKYPLTRQQELNIGILSYGKAILDELYDAVAIYDAWPTNPALKDRAGERPSKEQIAAYQGTLAFREDMAKRGVTLPDDSGLTTEQIALLSILTAPGDVRALNTKLRAAGVKPATYRAWLRQKPFNDAIKKLASAALNDALPIAEAQLAAQAEAGSLPALKFLMEVTGRHDPARQQAVDTQALIGVIVDVMQEEINQANMEELTAQELLNKIMQSIKFRAQGVKGVIT